VHSFFLYSYTNIFVLGKLALLFNLMRQPANSRPFATVSEVEFIFRHETLGTLL